ncbi:MAG: 50S ribosomal protein L29 [Pseudobdellovibrionaceae bacterium]|nr:50S ribosomal protein L29 [Pseudobdellovibrionaceae bacterium]
MKFGEIKNLELGELNKRLKTLRKELAELRFKNRMGRLENTSLIRSMRRDIARVQTAINLKRQSSEG